MKIQSYNINQKFNNLNIKKFRYLFIFDSKILNLEQIFIYIFLILLFYK